MAHLELWYHRCEPVLIPSILSAPSLCLFLGVLLPSLPLRTVGETFSVPELPNEPVASIADHGEDSAPEAALSPATLDPS